MPKNGTSGAETKKQRPLFNANIPPKWCRTRLFYAFSTFGWVLSQFKKIVFLAPFHPLKMTKSQKWNRTIFPLSVEVFKNCPIIRTLLPTKKQPRDFASWQKCQNVSLYCSQNPHQNLSFGFLCTRKKFVFGIGNLIFLAPDCASPSGKEGLQCARKKLILGIWNLVLFFCALEKNCNFESFAPVIVLAYHEESTCY